MKKIATILSLCIALVLMAGSTVTAQSDAPTVPATQRWAASDVPSLRTYALGQFADLSGSSTSIKTFGAVGDGSHDDTSAFAAGVNQVRNGTLYVPAGTYVINAVNMPSGSKLRMAGDGQGKTILKHKDGSTSDMLSSTSGL